MLSRYKEVHALDDMRKLKVKFYHIKIFDKVNMCSQSSVQFLVLDY